MMSSVEEKTIEEKSSLTISAFDDEFLLKADLSFFAEEILDMEISDHHKEWSRLVARHKKLAIQAPRDHGKSFLFSFAYTIWRLYHNWIPSHLAVSSEFKSVPRISLGYIFSNTQDQSIKLLELVKREIEENPKLEHLIPADRDIWSKTEIKVSNGAVVRARGWGQSVRGGHPVWIVADDCLNDESIYSELQRNKQIDYFFSAVTPMLVPGGQLIVVGTPFHREDLYQRLKENAAYHSYKSPALSSNGQALWPTRYSKEMLLARKQEVGSIRFSREYLCEAISDESSLFPEKILQQCYDYEFEMPRHLEPEERKQLRIYTGVDFAMSASVGADYTVITTLGVDKYQNRWILDIRRKKGLGLTEQLREIEDVYRQYKPIKILCENNGFQKIFSDELVRNTDMPIEGFTTTAGKKNSFDEGVPALQMLFENKKFVLGRKTERCREKTDVLINELKAFTYLDGKLQGLGAHDDTVLSLWIANAAISTHAFSFDFVGS
jgi:hypothetical protein